jgi:nucleotide-binding universal stress UspA family protein
MDDIIVGVDGSPSSRAALRWAAAIAGTHGARLGVLSAWQYSASIPLPLASVAPAAPEEMDRAVEEQTRKVLTEELGATADAVAIEVGRGPAATALLARAARDDISMLVLGARGLGGFSGMMLGSVTQQCVEHAKHPVVVIRGEDPDVETAPPSRVVVGHDGSDGAVRALEWCLDNVCDAGTEVVVVHAPNVGAERPVLEQAERVVNDEWCEPLRQRGASYSVRIDAGDPRDALMRSADDEQAGLIVVGTRGIGALRALVVGSVAAYLVRQATRPIAIVPEKEL